MKLSLLISSLLLVAACSGAASSSLDFPSPVEVQGPAGPPGEAGIGITGPQGIQGPPGIGIPGKQGVPGKDGVGIPGPAGPPGPTQVIIVIVQSDASLMSEASIVEVNEAGPDVSNDLSLEGGDSASTDAN